MRGTVCARGVRVVTAPSTAPAHDLRSVLLACHHARVPRFLTLADVAEVLSVSSAQAYALVRTGDLRAIKVGGRGQWRIEETELEAYIQRLYAETAVFVQEHPFDHDRGGVAAPIAVVDELRDDVVAR